MMKKLIIVFLVISLSFFSCRNGKEGSPNEGGTPIVSPHRSEAERQKIDGFVPSFPIGSSLAEIKKNFGEPLKQNVIDRQNVHNPARTDQIFELYYEGLFLQVYHVSETNKDLLVMIEVSSEKYPVKYGLVLGSSKDKVIGALGQPDDEKATYIRYFTGEYVMGALDFAFQANRLVSIRWNYFID